MGNPEKGQQAEQQASAAAMSVSEASAASSRLLRCDERLDDEEVTSVPRPAPMLISPAISTLSEQTMPVADAVAGGAVTSAFLPSSSPTTLDGRKQQEQVPAKPSSSTSPAAAKEVKQKQEQAAQLPEAAGAGAAPAAASPGAAKPPSPLSAAPAAPSPAAKPAAASPAAAARSPAPVKVKPEAEEPAAAGAAARAASPPAVATSSAPEEPPLARTSTASTSSSSSSSSSDDSTGLDEPHTPTHHRRGPTEAHGPVAPRAPRRGDRRVGFLYDPVCELHKGPGEHLVASALVMVMLGHACWGGLRLRVHWPAVRVAFSSALGRQHAATLPCQAVPFKSPPS